MKKKQQRISSSITKSTTTTTIKDSFRGDHPTTTKSELEEEQAQDTLLAKGPRKVSIPGHEQYSEDRYILKLQADVPIIDMVPRLRVIGKHSAQI